jgi:excinuclease UvrABC nuclease subunit
VQLLNQKLSKRSLSQLVDGLDLRSLPFVKANDVRALPRGAGVYFVFIGATLIYVGETEALRSRWVSHTYSHTVLHYDGSIHYLSTADDKEGTRSRSARRAIETAFIKRYKPILNNTKPKMLITEMGL